MPVTKRPLRKLIIERLEDRRLLASVLQLDHFDTWTGGVIPSTDPTGLTYHSPSGTLFVADSEINQNPEIFDGNNIFQVSLSGDRLVRRIESNNPEPRDITYNEFDGFFYVTNDNSDTITRYNNNLNNPLAVIDTTDIDPAMDDPEGITSDPLGKIYVTDAKVGTLQVLIFDSNLQFQSSFSVASQATDAEGIAYDPLTTNLFVMSSEDLKIFQYTTTGEFIRDYDISGLVPAPIVPQGITFAPTSNPNDSPDRMALYIADEMVDDVTDGRIYEIYLCNGSQNCFPFVDAGEDQNILITQSATLYGKVTDEG